MRVARPIELCRLASHWQPRIVPINYRHAFHAGNFADVLKHAVLARVLVYLTRKESPLPLHRHPRRRRPLRSGERGGEALAGMARGDRADPDGAAHPRRSPSSCAPILKPSVRTTPRAGHVSYPGSPAIAQTLMRAQDRIALCEANLGRTRGVDRRAWARPAAQHRRHGRLCRAQRLFAAEGAPRRRPDRPALRGAGRSCGASSGRSNVRSTQMADRDLHRLAADPRSQGRRPFPQFNRRAGQAKHPATRTRRRPRADRRAWPAAAARAPGFSSSIRRIR